MQAQRAVVHLKDQVNKLEAELEDQRTHKQMALVENEQLRMEVEALRAQTAIAASMQASVDDSESSFLQTHTFSMSQRIGYLILNSTWTGLEPIRGAISVHTHM